MRYTVARIAQVVHEAQRALQFAQGDPVPTPEWNYAPEYQKIALMKTVRLIIQGGTPEEAHELWMNDKISDGWTYAPIKDAYARKHPCLVPYDQLTQEQQDKDKLTVSIVNALADGIYLTDADKQKVVWIEDSQGNKAVAQVLFQEPDYAAYKKISHKKS